VCAASAPRAAAAPAPTSQRSTAGFQSGATSASAPSGDSASALILPRLAGGGRSRTGTNGRVLHTSTSPATEPVMIRLPSPLSAAAKTLWRCIGSFPVGEGVAGAGAAEGAGAAGAPEGAGAAGDPG
jgi:hypothetical protein